MRGLKNKCCILTVLCVQLNGGVRCEFENINYVSPSNGNAVIVMAGGDCFISQLDALFLPTMLHLLRIVAQSHMYFHSCVFEKCHGSGILCSGAQVVMRNSITRNTGGFGVEVRESGALVAVKCSISNSGRARVIAY